MADNHLRKKMTKPVKKIITHSPSGPKKSGAIVMSDLGDLASGWNSQPPIHGTIAKTSHTQDPMNRRFSVFQAAINSGDFPSMVL